MTAAKSNISSSVSFTPNIQPYLFLLDPVFTATYDGGNYKLEQVFAFTVHDVTSAKRIFDHLGVIVNTSTRDNMFLPHASKESLGFQYSYFIIHVCHWSYDI